MPPGVAGVIVPAGRSELDASVRTRGSLIRDGRRRKRLRTDGRRMMMARWGSERLEEAERRIRVDPMGAGHTGSQRQNALGSPQGAAGHGAERELGRGAVGGPAQCYLRAASSREEAARGPLAATFIDGRGPQRATRRDARAAARSAYARSGSRTGPGWGRASFAYFGISRPSVPTWPTVPTARPPRPA